MAAVAKLPPTVLEQPSPTGVRFVAGGALAHRYRRMNDRQARSVTDTTVALTAQDVLRLEHESLAPRSMGIMAGSAFVECWRVNRSCVGGLRILMALDAEIARLVLEEAVMVGLMPTMAGCALRCCRVRPRQGDFFANIRVARAA